MTTPPRWLDEDELELEPRPPLVVMLPPSLSADDCIRVLVAVVREQERIADLHRRSTIVRAGLDA